MTTEERAALLAMLTRRYGDADLAQAALEAMESARWADEAARWNR